MSAVFDPGSTLKALRWDADMLVTNHEGERVWLREAYDEAGVRTGITDCCHAETPCKWHAALATRAALREAGEGEK